MLMLIARYSALLLVTAIVTWALVLGWWQSNGHTPTPGESLLYLLALPMALVGGFLFLNAFFKGMKPPADTPPAAQEVPDTADTARLAREASMRRRQMAVLAHAVVTPGATDASGCVDLIREGKSPQPDPKLKDHDGFPAFAARNTQLDESLRDDALRPFAEPPQGSETQVRNIALVDQLLGELLPELSNLVDADAIERPFLRIRWLTDTPLSTAQSDALREWLLDRMDGSFDRDRAECALVSTEDPIAAATQIEQLCALSGTQPDSALTLLIASASNVSERRIDQWQSDGRLFLPDHQQGQIPGEVASALLLGTPQTALALGVEDPVLISRPNAQARDKSADSPGRISASLCARLCQELLVLFGIEAGKIKALATDGDHRTSRQTEALGALDESFEQLEPSQDFLAVGTHCGSAPPAAFMLTLACAAHLTEATEGPVIALGLQDPTRRAAMLLTRSTYADPPPPAE